MIPHSTFILVLTIGMQLQKVLCLIVRLGGDIGFMIMKRKNVKNENVVVVVVEDFGHAVVRAVHRVAVYWQAYS